MKKRIVTSISNEILNTYRENGNIYIPQDIKPYVPGGLIMCSCDNIDVLEETLSGKNTFHSTQMVVWQRRRPPLDKPCSSTVTIGRDKALKREVMEHLHRLDQAPPSTGKRPNPVMKSLPKGDDWFNASEEREKAESKDRSWVLLRHNAKD